MSRQNVIVTGASSGIGQAVAARLHDEGYHVFNLDRQPPASASTVSEYIDVDLADANALHAVMKALTQAHAITRVVNNAGIVKPAYLPDTAVDDMREVAKVNVEAPLMIVQHVLPEMLAQGFGRIVNISSRVVLGKERRTAYAASKSALLGMTRTWAMELADKGITVNAIGPGPIGTELFHQVNPAGLPQTKAIIDRLPVKRVGKPEEIAHAVSYFMHDLASFTTGQILYVCGGMTLGVADA